MKKKLFIYVYVTCFRRRDLCCIQQKSLEERTCDCVLINLRLSVTLYLSFNLTTVVKNSLIFA